MKQLIKAVIVFGFTLAVASSTSFGQAGGPVITIDELGNSSGLGLGIGPGVLGPDPSGGLTVPVLVFFAPFPIVTGDVVLLEPGGQTGQISDIVRFWNPIGVGSGLIIFYSDVSPTDLADALADTGLPALLPIPPVFIPEIGPEGLNGAIWTPPPGAPGSGVAGITYNIISDGVIPEPSSAALLLSGVGILFGINRLRRKA